jgi:oligopeptide/dipeptide ABC transporter ATP-binding protein
VRHIAQRVVVLYRGRVVEEGASETVLARPAHPYTALLVAAAPVPDPDVQRRRRAQLPTQATLAQPQASHDSCLFAARCPMATDLCRSLRPPLEPVDGGHAVACHHWRAFSATTNEETTTCAYAS